RSHDLGKFQLRQIFDRLRGANHLQTLLNQRWVEKAPQIKFDLLVGALEEDVVPLRGLHATAEFLDAAAANGGASGRGRTKAVAGDVQLGVGQAERVLIPERVIEALLLVQQVIREIEAAQ